MSNPVRFCRECQFFSGYGNGPFRLAQCTGGHREFVRGSYTACHSFVGWWVSNKIRC